LLSLLITLHSSPNSYSYCLGAAAYLFWSHRRILEGVFKESSRTGNRGKSFARELRGDKKNGA
jgi:hypothetical protein